MDSKNLAQLAPFRGCILEMPTFTRILLALPMAACTGSGGVRCRCATSYEVGIQARSITAVGAVEHAGSGQLLVGICRD